MKAKLLVRDLEIVCIIGIHPHERERPQPVLLDLTFEYDVLPAAKSDSIEDAVDYEPIVAALSEFICREKFFLIERLAYECSRKILRENLKIDRVTLKVRKPGAIPNAAFSAIECSLSRAESGPDLSF